MMTDIDKTIEGEQNEKNTPMANTLRKEVMVLSADNSGGKNRGEILTLTQVEADLTDVPGLDKQLDTHFSSVATQIRGKLGNGELDSDATQSTWRDYMTTTLKDTVSTGVRLDHTVTAQFYGRKDMYRVNLQSVQPFPEGTQPLHKDGNNTQVLVDRELAINDRGQAYMSGETYKMLLDVYIKNSKGNTSGSSN